MPKIIVINKAIFQNTLLIFSGIKLILLKSDILILSIKYIPIKGISINTIGLYINACFISNLNKLFNNLVVPHPGQ